MRFCKTTAICPVTTVGQIFCEYKKTKQLIEESENIIQKYAKRYDGIINSKDNEINILKIQLQDLKNETNSLKKQLNNIPFSVRKMYKKITF